MATQWWRNWASSYGFVASEVMHPTTLDELVQALASTPANTPVRAVGGGWSASDASIPFATTAEATLASIAAHATQSMPNVGPGGGKLLENHATNSIPIDRTPLAFDQALNEASMWKPASGAWEFDPSPPGAATALANGNAIVPHFGDLTQIRTARLIDTREMHSSLQSDLRGILSSAALQAQAASKASPRPFSYFHVQAGITIAELNTLLDFQSPRLALRSSSGSPGATLAGAIATATHGAELKDDLLVDTVMAVHLVAPDGTQWWIEGSESIADPAALAVHYPGVASHIIAGPKTLSVTLDGVTATATAEDVLRAVSVSLGSMGVIYSVVLKVFPQYGVRQVVKRHPTAAPLLAAASALYATRKKPTDPASFTTALADYNATANRAVYETVLDGVKCGTDIAASKNTYCDLAFNPRTHQCWVTHREEVPNLPLASSVRSGGLASDLAKVLDTAGASTHQGGLDALLKYLGYSVQVPTDFANDIDQAKRLFGWITGWSQPLSAGLAALAAQVKATSPSNQRPLIAGDILTALLNAVQGLDASDRAEVIGRSYAVGDVGWPNGGIPGAALEVALDPNVGFSFLFNDLLGDILKPDISEVLFGYISVRICAQTKSLIGMQQFSPHSVMIELVGYRSPDAAKLFERIQQRVLDRNINDDLGALLHWGLQNEKFTFQHLDVSPLGKSPGGGAPSKAELFRAIRQAIAGDRMANTMIRRCRL